MPDHSPEREPGRVEPVSGSLRPSSPTHEARDRMSRLDHDREDPESFEEAFYGARRSLPDALQGMYYNG